MSTHFEALLARLEKVQSNGPGKYKACCPAHSDKTPSLYLTEKDDGRILIHCFSGCTPDEIVGAVGMQLQDLFPPAIGHYKPTPAKFSARDVLALVSREVDIAALILDDITRNRAPNDADFDRIAQCASRLGAAMVYVNG